MRPHPTLAALLVLCACGSAGRREPYRPTPEAKKARAIGAVLASLDNHIVAWNHAKLEAPSAENLTRLHGIEVVVRTEARAHVDEILEQLRAGPPRNRRIAAAALGFAQDPHALDALLAAAAEEDADVANNALLGLGVLATPAGPRTAGLLPPLPPLLQVLETSKDGLRRTNAAFAIKRSIEAGSRAPGSRARLEAALDDLEGGVRAQCAVSLGALGEKEAAAALLARAEDPDPVVRASVAFALGRLGAESARGKLEEMRLSREPGVREAARGALAALGAPASAPAPR